MFVTEPNRNWHVDSYNSHRTGKLEFPEPGYYDIVLELDPERKERINFQWLWLGEQ
jgi:hypothetical protein